MLPGSLPYPLRYDQTEKMQYESQLVTVWKGRWNGRVIAARILVAPGSDMERTKKVGAAQRVVLSNELIISTEVP